MAKPMRCGSVRPMLAGRVSFSSFTEALIKAIDEILNNEAGIVPDNLLAPTTKYHKRFKRPISSGILPSKLLSGIKKWTRNDIFPTEGGMLPVKLFPVSISTSSLDKDPSLGGIPPTSLFRPKSIILS